MKAKSISSATKTSAAARWICLTAALLALGACGGGSKTTSTAVGSYTIGGTIKGLTPGTSVVLIYNDTTKLTVAAGTTTWAFPGTFPGNASYSVTVQTQPTGELCSITIPGSGTTLTADVNDVTVICNNFGQWTWEQGSNLINTVATYGTQGAAAASNEPGAREAASSWTDAAGNFWLFGGYGYSSSGVLGALNDLWQYNPSSAQWTWVGDPNAINTVGTYGTQGTAAAGNAPGARQAASSWFDASGNLWLFGGYGFDSAGNDGNLSDLWRYSPSTGQWTWVSGAQLRNASGVYGTQGAAAAGDAPGARQAASSWIDASGNLWLFGGYGNDSSTSAGILSDLWRFSPASGQWTWVSGSQLRNTSGVYGTQGTAALSDLPGARQGANAWIDASGNLWLFGGYGYDADSGLGSLNDLWQYSPSSGDWTWIGGSQARDASGAYGVQGIAAAGDAPGARQAASSWVDASGNFWLFGGADSSASADGYLNDLWQYSPSSGRWTWVSGGNGINSAGSYGEQGTVSAGSAPGSRQAANSWVDPSGTLWLFGGVGFSSDGNGYLNDLWQFVIPP